MRSRKRKLVVVCSAVLMLLVFGASADRMGAKDRTSPTNPNDPTFRLFSLLDSKYNGKVDDFCMLADLINDPKNPDSSSNASFASSTTRTRGLES
jgi:hypothetical protein